MKILTIYQRNFFWRMFAVKTVGEKVYGDSLREFKVEPYIFLLKYCILFLEIF